jgi:hypothetical protein
MLINVTGSLCIEKRAREWCKLPYPGHPNGCPNYGVASDCPPKVCFVNDFMNLLMEHFFIVETFDLSAHAKTMAAVHPEWSEKQCKCCLYWQNGVRKRLRQQCGEFIKQHPGYVFTLIPEAMGVNVFRTAHRHGLMIRKNPTVVHKVALVGMALKSAEALTTANNSASMQNAQLALELDL